MRSRSDGDICLRKLKLSPVANLIRASVLGIGLMHSTSYAGTIMVTSNLDDGIGCTLREAISSVNDQLLRGNCAVEFGTLGNRDTISFDSSLSNSLIKLENGALFISSSMSIDASNLVDGVVIDGDLRSRVFQIDGSSVSMNNISIKGGVTNTFAFGGGINASNSNVELTHVTISDNTASQGAGIFVSGASTSSLTITNSTISNNSATFFGGGMSSSEVGTTLVNSTISSNDAENGGGIHISDGFVTLVNTTVSDNSTEGVYLSGGVLRLKNSIVANSKGGIECDSNPYVLEPGVVFASASNIIEDGSCNTGAKRGDPNLLPLADNGGLTLTHALAETSQAVNIGEFNDCPSRDQRDELRGLDDGYCDLGAFELNVAKSSPRGYMSAIIDFLFSETD